MFNFKIKNKYVSIYLLSSSHKAIVWHPKTSWNIAHEPLLWFFGGFAVCIKSNCTEKDYQICSFSQKWK